MLENTEGAIKSGHYRETATQGTQEKDKHNVGEYRKGKQRWTLQRNWQHRVHKTNTNITLENTERAIKGGHYTETDNIGYTKKKTKITLENTERAIKSRHYRETGNIGYTKQRQT